MASGNRSSISTHSYCPHHPNNQRAKLTPGGQLPLDSSADVKNEFAYDLEVSHEPETLAENAVQIIFVHGLGGSMRGTWTDSEANFWPAWLGNERGLENVRIATFGYNSVFNVIAPNTNLSISTFAIQLLESIKLLIYERGSVQILYTVLIVGGDHFRGSQLGRIVCKTGTAVLPNI